MSIPRKLNTKSIFYKLLWNDIWGFKNVLLISQITKPNGFWYRVDIKKYRVTLGT